MVEILISNSNSVSVKNWDKCITNNKPLIEIRKQRFKHSVKYSLETYEPRSIQEIAEEAVFGEEIYRRGILTESSYVLMKEAFVGFYLLMHSKFKNQPTRFHIVKYGLNQTTGHFDGLTMDEAQSLANGIKKIIEKDIEIKITKQNQINSDFFRRDWVESQKEIYNKIQELKKQEGTEKDIALLNNLLKQSNDSKGLHLIIKEASKQENFELSSYRIEKLSQAVIEGIQDYFKDVFKEQEQQESKLREYIKEGMKRFREWQRWSEKEINDLIYLWKVKCKKPNEIGRLMQRSSGSIERMIDFIECDKYLNSKNFYKKIESKLVLEEKK